MIRETLDCRLGQIARWLLITLALTLGLAGCAPSGKTSSQDSEALAKRLYRDGILHNEEPLKGVSQLDIPMVGQAAACANCHGRSGMGYSEASTIALPITGPKLYHARTFDPRSRLGRNKNKSIVIRPAYTDETLARAIREGVDSAGRPLKPMMPRYPLSDQEMALLIGYLKNLGAKPPPGVTETELHFATVVAEGVDPVKRKAMLELIETYVTTKNAQTRNEVKRAERAPYGAWHKEWDYQAYRKWRHHVWELSGSPDSWQEQLEEYQKSQPVFALVSGMVTGPWAPVHRFCEEHEIPCVLPITDLPVVSEEKFFYTIYFDKGKTLEAQALAVYLAKQGIHGSKVMQVYREDAAGRTAAQALSRRFESLAPGRPADCSLDTDGPQFPGSLVRQGVPDVLVLWLPGEDLTSALNSISAWPEKPKWIFVSATFAPDFAKRVPAGLRDKIFATYPYEMPEKVQINLLRMTGWMRMRKLAMLDRPVQMRTFFALRMFGEGLMHLVQNFNQDYFLEKIEHAFDERVTVLPYPRVSLAPGQRYLSKGCYVVRLVGGRGNKIQPVSSWIIP